MRYIRALCSIREAVAQQQRTAPCSRDAELGRRNRKNYRYVASLLLSSVQL